MSEQEEIKLFDRIYQGIVSAQKRMLEHKTKRGERVILADANGLPKEVSAEEALRLFDNNG